jgi:hypothetical protein
MVMMCKKCKKAFRKVVDEFEESDEYCPHVRTPFFFFFDSAYQNYDDNKKQASIKGECYVLTFLCIFLRRKCDNHYILEAKTPKPMIGIEGEDARVDARGLATRDERSNKIDRQAELAKLLEEEFASKVD